MIKRTLIFLFLSVSIVFADSPFGANFIPRNDLKRNWDLSFKYGFQGTLTDTLSEESWMEGDKKPTTSMLLSAVLPGAGEFYTHAYLRAVGFAAVEAAFWSGRSHFNNKGESIEKKYKSFADEHWSLQRWLDNFDTSGETGDPQTHEIWIYCVGVQGLDDGYYSYDSLLSAGYRYEEGMTPVNNRDFYENIGKYDQFSKGWDDAYDEFGNPLIDIDGNLVRDTENREKYLSMRKDSNDALKTAIQFSSLILINHVVSAIDAIIAAKQYNIRSKVSFHMGVTTDIVQKKVNGIKLIASW